MAVIRILDQHTAELIAAGEVVERPASAAKELLENAIDAGAGQITISITRGGIQQIQVTDNGSGIEAEYIANAFVRHATSKIQTEQDLDSIHTLGFRGEALASIASVARVEVLTRTEQDEFACVYRIEGGKELGLEIGARPVGTTITVNDLFYNTPARMKFLKKDVSEGTFVADVVLPDILVLGKVLTGGYIGHADTVANHKVYDAFYSDDDRKALMHGPTFMGNALACAAALKGIEIFEREDYMSKIARIEAISKREMLGFADPRIKEVRVMGGCTCVEVYNEADLEGFQQFAYERGVFSRPFLKYMYSMVPYVIQEDELVRIFDVMKEWFRR